MQTHHDAHTHFAQSHPFGSARFASAFEVRRAFRKQGGIPIGFFQRRMLFHSKQAGALLIGGAGSGKFTTILSHILAAPGRGKEPPRYLILDPKGEMAAVIGPGLAQIGAHVWFINPYNLHGLPNHAPSLLGHLRADSQYLVADSRRMAAALLPETGGGNAKFFEQKGQNWLDAITRGLVHARGGVSFQSLFDTLGMIRAAPHAWTEFAREMSEAGGFDVTVTLREMRDMAEESRKTFESVVSEIANALSFMADPALQDTLVDETFADFTLDVLNDSSGRPVFVFLMMPAELLAQNAAVIRQTFSTLRTLKQRSPQSPTVNLIIDEAAQLGRFKEIAEFYAIGRGFGLSPLCVYQDIGQIHRNLGQTGAMTLSASADAEIYLGGGISDLNTAQHLSQKLGQQTLRLDDQLTQIRAEKARREAVRGVLLEGQSAMKAGHALRHLSMERAHQRSQGRALMSADEILTMPHDKALVWPSGYGIRPFLADKVPYYDVPRYAGRYFPNPYFDSAPDALNVRTRWSARKRRVITEDVPEALKDFPQHRHGEWRFIEGFRPKL